MGLRSREKSRQRRCLEPRQGALTYWPTPRNSMARANERQGHITAHGCERARLNGLFLRKAHRGRVYWEGSRSVGEKGRAEGRGAEGGETCPLN